MIKMSVHGASDPCVLSKHANSKQRQPDITLARGPLGCAHSIQHAEGLVKTIAYFKTIVR